MGLALYVHIPWCVRKCPYCDFNSHESRDIPEADYIAALLRDLEQDLEQDLLQQPFWAQGREISSIFFGGGTPSLFSAASYDQLLQAIHQKIPIARQAEITLEANPGTFEYEKFAGFRQAGINRLSIGVQSFADDKLAALGRIHNRDNAIRAIAAAHEVGFAKVNVDLMHGLPRQSVADALADLQQAIDLHPTHLSWYQLTIEPNTVFYRRPPTLPDDDALGEIEDAGWALLQQQGYQRYETSAYAQPGFQCKHNLNYWRFGDYLALGAGAHGKLTLADGRVLRYQKTRLPQDYLHPDKAFTAKQHVVAQPDLPFEFFMNALRLMEPITKSLFSERTGLALQTVEKPVAHAVAQGLLEDHPDHWRTTELGQRFLNTLLNLFH
ncbi:radical SAM family heme chaperone HemW [Ketobacter sp.]|uniref:radical SAM family heme chaperone HemW n=1 Tax=Ketobacter sp. TaxID=2083498 RepID=UPI000F1D68C1|nr:radical SAM family heme chaperone HemW [Ketobacter sp.]RLT95111.1 MAG: radical SAM family heme chaperone HemW [Ketobacter sp.]